MNRNIKQDENGLEKKSKIFKSSKIANSIDNNLNDDNIETSSLKSMNSILLSTDNDYMNESDESNSYISLDSNISNISNVSKKRNKLSEKIKSTDQLKSIKTKTEMNTQPLMDYIKTKGVKFGDKTLTHQWWDNNKNINFKIADDEYDEFLRIYANEYKKTKKNKILHVMEQPKENGPLCLDFDLKQNSPERSIEIDDITQIIGIVNNILCSYYLITNEEQLESYVFMKSDPFYNKEKNLYSDGFHLMYPKLILNVADRFFVFDESKKEIIRQDLFSNVYSFLASINENDDSYIGSNIDTDDDLSDQEQEKYEKKDNLKYYKLSEKQKETINNEIFDSSVIIKNKWFMYGSGKNINSENNLYELEYIFDSDINEIDEKPKSTELVKLLSIRKPSNDSNVVTAIKSNQHKKMMEIVQMKYMKKILNINRFFKETNEFEYKLESNYNLNCSNFSNINKLSRNRNNNINSCINDVESSDDSSDEFDNEIDNELDDNYINQKQIGANINNKILNLTNKNLSKKYDDKEEEAIRLVRLLSAQRAKPYNEWIAVGWALYNISPKLYPEFIEFSKKAGKKFDEEGCKKVWLDCSARSDNSGYNIFNLVKWAKDDNMDGYKKILSDKIDKLFDTGDLRTDFDVAGIIKEIYKYEFKCSSIKNGTWWHFDNHKWNRVENAFTLNLKLSTDVCLEFAKLHSKYIGMLAQEHFSKGDEIKKKCKDIQTLIFNLKKTPSKERLIKECSNLFYEKNFEAQLDQNNFLVGFSNGVYDLKNRIFRAGLPGDMIGKTTNYAYLEFNYSDPIIIEIENFIRNIQPEEDMSNYLMAYSASFWEGSNRDQKFMIWTGVGSNGKGTLIELYDNTFNGEIDGYFGALPPTVLTQKRGSSSAATPELADKFGKRVIVLQEPEGDDKINVGFMKNITGQDKIEARPLYGDPFQYTPQFKLLLACNHLPNIPSDDGGTWRRIRVIDFGIKFKSNPDETKNERKADPFLREKLKTWKQGFAWLLLNKYYPLYVEKGLDALEPERVKISTNKYKADSNVFMEFFNEMLENDPDSKFLLFTNKKNDIDNSDNDCWNIFRSWFKTAYSDKKPFNRKTFIEYFKNSGFKIENTKEGVYILGVRQKLHEPIEKNINFTDSSDNDSNSNISSNYSFNSHMHKNN